MIEWDDVYYSKSRKKYFVMMIGMEIEIVPHASRNVSKIKEVE